MPCCKKLALLCNMRKITNALILQALHYFMVRPMEDENPGISAQFEDPDSLSALLPELERSIESAMAASSGRPGSPPMPPQESQGKNSARAGVRPWGRQRVLARLEVVRGVPFYGYHCDEKLFVKVMWAGAACLRPVALVVDTQRDWYIPFVVTTTVGTAAGGDCCVPCGNTQTPAGVPKCAVGATCNAGLPSMTGERIHGHEKSVHGLALMLCNKGQDCCFPITVGKIAG